MKKYALFFSLIFTISLYAQNGAIATIDKNIKNIEWNSIKDLNALEKTVDVRLQTVNNQNSWDDTDLTSTKRTRWPPIKYLEIINKMALVYSYPKSKFYKSSVVFNQIKACLEHWKSKKPKSVNGWFNTMATPKKLGLILLLVDAKTTYPETLIHALIPVSKAKRVNSKGANLVDLSINGIYKSVVYNDILLLKKWSYYAFKPVRLSKGLGIQYDLSFLQHDKQLHIASYGAVFIGREIEAMKYLKNTRYQIAPDKLNLFSRFILNTYLNTTRGAYIDFNVMGRAISRPGRSKVSGMASNFSDLIKIDPKNKDKYLGAVTRLNSKAFNTLSLYTKRNRQYWAADYTLHNRKKYTFSIRTSSRRTIKSERLNDENIMGYFLTEGATPILVNGNEYFDIFPLWDWTKIPGVTAPAYNLPIIRKDRWTRGSTSFVGGVSDGTYGVSTYDFSDYKTKAKKAWFLFDDEIVCLGAGISSFSDKPVSTTLNQSWLDGKIYYDENNKLKELKDQQLRSTKIDWIVHDSIGYYFPKKTRVNLSANTEKGTWNSINFSASKDTVSGKVFKLFIDHGLKPKKATYQYVVIPALTSMQTIKKYPVKNIQITANLESHQVVYHKKLDLLQAVFYKAGSYKLGMATITIDSPCVLMVKNVTGKAPMLYIADPTQKINTLKISIQIKGQKPSKHLTVKFPSGPYAGSTISYAIN